MKLLRARRWLPALALLLAVVAGFTVWNRQPGLLDRRLAGYRAAGLPTTPDELDAWYLPVPDAENAATALLEAASAWRPSTQPLPTAPNGLSYPPRGQAWPASLLAAVRMELATNALPLAQIHSALERSRSRYPVNLKAGSATAVPHLALAKQAGRNLTLEARFAAETGDPERATAALQAALRAARTLAEEPLLISYQIRISMDFITLETTESVLTQTALPEGDLRRLQAAFAAAEVNRQLARAIVSERCLALDQGSQPAAPLFADFVGQDTGGASARDATRIFPLLLGQVYELSGLKGRDVEFYLDRSDELAQAAAGPVSGLAARQHQVQTRIETLSKWSALAHPIAYRSLQRVYWVLSKEIHSVATFRCAQTAMAVERWRLAHDGSLPRSLDSLVPEYLTAVPEDPVDGQPLKFRPLSPGYVVYSIGEDGRDDGGRERPSPFTRMKGKGWDYTFTVAR
ncbi:MAG TPA: hypothetical protein VMB21_09780 [Candidatus Limnocylindria bacterium]|nr:hypothetical protein [Candidatus Limnocylindria bacterium]